MSRPRRTPAYRKHKASGQAVVTIDGRDVYLGPYGTDASYREYDRILAEWLANGRRLPDASGSHNAHYTVIGAHRPTVFSFESQFSAGSGLPK